MMNSILVSFGLLVLSRRILYYPPLLSQVHHTRARPRGDQGLGNSGGLERCHREISR